MKSSTVSPPMERLIWWLPPLLGVLALYIPSLKDLFQGVWSRDEQMHGPIILGISIWLLYRNWAKMESSALNGEPTNWGWTLIGIGLATYIIGRSQDILMFEVGSSIWILIGLLLLTRGVKALRVQWFSFFFMLFMVPLPAIIVDTVTMPMKMAVSYAAEHILYWLDYPIGRQGVILQIGQYKLLVADACAGLHTLLTLEALGLLYLNVVERSSTIRNTSLAILIVPISFTANVIRVITLTLVTYHYGDEAGQGFLHKFAGMVLFLTALFLIISFDSILHAIEAKRQKNNGQLEVAR